VDENSALLTCQDIGRCVGGGKGRYPQQPGPRAALPSARLKSFGPIERFFRRLRRLQLHQLASRYRLKAGKKVFGRSAIFCHFIRYQ